MLTSPSKLAVAIRCGIPNATARMSSSCACFYMNIMEGREGEREIERRVREGRRKGDRGKGKGGKAKGDRELGIL